MCKKELYVVGSAIMMIMAAVIFFPTIGSADSLTPSDAPAATPPILNNVMDKLDNILNKLDNMPSTWSQKLQPAQRFELVLDGEAVLDRETGLVWEKSPTSDNVDWYNAVYRCAQRVVGGREGWHLPTVEQLTSLVDQSVGGSPKLPAGHPFTVVQNPACWSATTYESNDTSHSFAWGVEFSDGRPLPAVKSLEIYSTWCVRGGQSMDGH